MARELTPTRNPIAGYLSIAIPDGPALVELLETVAAEVADPELSNAASKWATYLRAAACDSE